MQPGRPYHGRRQHQEGHRGSSRAAHLTRCQFLGGHPMAGRERFGVEAAEAGLFRGRPYVLTPRVGSGPETPASAQSAGLDRPNRRLSGHAGRRTARPRRGLYVASCRSLASTALGVHVGRPQRRPSSGIFGPALVDSTRLSLSSFRMWGDILATNRASIQDALRNYIAKLEEFCRELEPEQMRSEFDRAARFARQLRDSTRGASG